MEATDPLPTNADEPKIDRTSSFVVNGTVDRALSSRSPLGNHQQASEAPFQGREWRTGNKSVSGWGKWQRGESSGGAAKFGRFFEQDLVQVHLWGAFYDPWRNCEPRAFGNDVNGLGSGGSNSNGWGSTTGNTNSHGWGTTKNLDDRGWGNTTNNHNDRGWGSTAKNDGWGSTTKNDGWGSTTKDDGWDSWGSTTKNDGWGSTEGSTTNPTTNKDGWGCTKENADDHGWGNTMENRNDQGWGSTSDDHGWGLTAKDVGWGVTTKNAEDDGWGGTHGTADDHGWDSTTTYHTRNAGNYGNSKNVGNAGRNFQFKPPNNLSTLELHLRGAFYDPWRRCLPVLINETRTFMNLPSADGEPSGLRTPDPEMKVSELRKRKPDGEIEGCDRSMKKQAVEAAAADPWASPAAEHPEDLRNWLGDTKPSVAESDAWGPIVVSGQAESDLGMNSESEVGGGLIFECNKETWKICKAQQLFGLGPEHAERVLRVVPGTRLFLFNYETRNLIGMFQATSKGDLNIVPEAFAPFGDYPAQVRVKRILKFPALPAAFLKTTIPGNFSGGNSISTPLTASQVEKLVILFKMAQAIFFT